MLIVVNLIILVVGGCGSISRRSSASTERNGVRANLIECTSILRVAFSELKSCLVGGSENSVVRDLAVEGVIKIAHGELFIESMRFKEDRDPLPGSHACLTKAMNTYRQDIRWKAFGGFDPIRNEYVYPYSGILFPEIKGEVRSTFLPEVESF